jgi:hypothetical protein
MQPKQHVGDLLIFGYLMNQCLLYNGITKLI